jgi:hypothetical protein
MDLDAFHLLLPAVLTVELLLNVLPLPETARNVTIQILVVIGYARIRQPRQTIRNVQLTFQLADISRVLVQMPEPVLHTLEPH